jgi:GGDEF domain-containing protein
LPNNVLPFTRAGRRPERLVGRLNAALRVRSLHATLLRRLFNNRNATRMPTSDPIEDATVLLLGRGASYPALSVALGEQMGVIGALSIEAAAKHLNARELDGIIVGEGFTLRVLDAFLTVLSEDSRFRNLPVVVASPPGLIADHDLPNLEIVAGDPRTVAAHAVPLIRQQAFEARINRALKSIDVGGLLDPRTGLLTNDAFNRDFETAVAETQTRGAGLSVARITFAHGSTSERMRLDAARILSRLMRRMDFATLDDTGAIYVVFAETDLRNAHAIARRLASVLKHTMHSTKRDQRLDPQVTVAALMPGDTASAILGRLHTEAHRVAS